MARVFCFSCNVYMPKAFYRKWNKDSIVFLHIIRKKNAFQYFNDQNLNINILEGSSFDLFLQSSSKTKKSKYRKELSTCVPVLFIQMKDWRQHKNIQ